MAGRMGRGLYPAVVQLWELLPTPPRSAPPKESLGVLPRLM